MTSPENPVIILMHGAWHRPRHYIYLIDHLKSRGCQVIAPALPTARSALSINGMTVQDDGQAIQNNFLPIIEAGREVVVLCHSYSGIPATDSVADYTSGERKAQSVTGGIKAVIYIAALVPPQAQLSFMNIIGVEDQSDIPSWWSESHDLAVLNRPALKEFYQDVDETVAGACYQSTVSQSFHSFQCLCKHPAGDLKVQKAYVATRSDNVVPYDGQVGMARASAVDITTLECGHSPFLRMDMLVQLVKVVDDVARS